MSIVTPYLVSSPFRARTILLIPFIFSALLYTLFKYIINYVLTLLLRCQTKAMPLLNIKQIISLLVLAKRG